MRKRTPSNRPLLLLLDDAEASPYAPKSEQSGAEARNHVDDLASEDAVVEVVAGLHGAIQWRCVCCQTWVCRDVPGIPHQGESADCQHGHYRAEHPVGSVGPEGPSFSRASRGQSVGTGGLGSLGC